MDERTVRTAQAAIVAIAPVALAAALLTHPYLPGRMPNEAAIAAAVADDPTRWGLVHLATGFASGLLILAFLAVRSHLRDAGDDRRSAVGVPFIVIGSTLFTMLPAMEFAPLTAAVTGGTLSEIAAAQAALAGWFVPVLAFGGATFGIGVVAFIRAITATGILGRTRTAVVVAGLALLALSRFVPLAAVQFYVQSAAAIVALWPLAHHLWQHRAIGPARPARDAAPAS